ncbi:MAG TPA: UbiD family decarboxylase [Actinomycetes bacterium]|nr:UbiD family decarboxylase [Actinomycetes bacterium]
MSEAGALLVVERAVDRTWEITAVLDRLERDHRFPAVRFSSIKGFPGWSVVGNVFASRPAIAALLDAPVDRLTEEVARRLERPIDPVLVDDGPVHDRVLTGDEATLEALPIPTHHERDAGPYLSYGVAVCKDPETGARNVGIYRFMQRGPRELVPSLTSISNIADIFARQEAKGRPLDLAILPGVTPLLGLAASYKAPLGTDELALAGALAGEPLELVRATTIDVEVPAAAEVVIEARVRPGERYPEAPFADMSRAYSRQKMGPLVEVKAITHRADPILQLAFSGHPDATNLAAVCHEVAIWRAVSQSSSCVTGVHVPASGYGFHCYLGVHKLPTVEGRERGEHRNAMLAAVGAVPQIKLVVAVDDDVDIYDDTAVMGALARRFQAVDPLTGEPRLTVLPNLKGASYDPSSFHREYPNAKLLVDCTLRSDLDEGQRASFEEARCRGSDDLDLDAYLG